MTTRDDHLDDGEHDDLFAAASAAVSRPRRPGSSPKPPPEPEPEPRLEADADAEPEPALDPEPEPAPARDTTYDHLFGPPADADPDESSHGDSGTGGSADDGSGGEPPSDGSGAHVDEPTGRHWGRIALLVAALLLGGAYLGGYFATGLRMPASVSVAGVDVSGLSPSAAESVLTRELTPRTERTIVLEHQDKQLRLDPEDAGLSLDVPASVVAAGGARSWDPRDMVALLFGDHPHDAVVDADPTKLAGVLEKLGEAVDREVVQAQITFPKSEPKARKPVAGSVVDQPATVEAIEDGYVGDGEPVAVVMRTVQPAVDQAGLDAAMDGIAKTAVSAPVELQVGSKEIRLPVPAFAPALVVRVEDGELTPHLDAKKLAEPLADSTSDVGKKAVDATVRIRDGKPKVIPGKEGIGLQPQEMAVKLLPAIAATGVDRTVQVEAKSVEPLFTTADAKALKITEKIGEFETQFPYAEYRNTNQGRAARLIDDTIIKPGGTFSFNDIVGERTAANGFVTGTVINGGVFREELGGGVSQVATTMYNAAFFGGMVDTEHHPHAFYIDRYPVGREATVYFGSLDLRWKNPTKYGVLVQASVVPSRPGVNGRMRVQLWSTKVWDDVRAGASARTNFRKAGTQYDDSDRCVAQAPVRGFDIDIYRSFYRDGKRVKTETDRARYQAADKVVCGKKPEKDD